MVKFFKPAKTRKRKHHNEKKDGASSVHPVQVTVARMNHSGQGVATHPSSGKTLFIDNALPSESVLVNITAETSRFLEGTVEKVFTSSPSRVTPVCPHYNFCGGCNLQHLQPSSQLDMKASTVIEQLLQQIQVQPAGILPPIQSPANGYRTRARLGVGYHQSQKLFLGFREKASKKLTSIKSCPVLVPSLQQLIQPLTDWLSMTHGKSCVTHVDLLEDMDGPCILLRALRPLSEQEKSQLKQFAELASVRLWLQYEKKGALYTLSGETDDPRLHYQLPSFGVNLAYHPKDFTQVNRFINEKMIIQALTLLSPQKGERVLDLFCGIGNFTLPLARSGAEVLGVEGDAEMVLRAQENSRKQGLNKARFKAADLEADQNWLWYERFDAILLDPPRAGAKQIMARLGELKAKRIVYVSCNSATFARDATILLEQGYVLEQLGVMDMFPHTAHIETMALFSRHIQ